MNTTIIAAIIVLVVLGGGIFYYNSMYPTEDMMMEKGSELMDEGGAMMEKGEDMMEKGDDMMKEGAEMKGGGTMMESGSYEAYSPEKIANANEGDVVLFFRASWCPTCRGLDADIKAHLKDIPQGVTILDVNYDDSTALKQKYGVTYQHTLVQVDAAGNRIAQWDSSPTLSSLVSNIK